MDLINGDHVHPLVRRIEETAKEHPEVYQLDSAWGLFKIPGFECDDLQPTLGQAQAALAIVKQRRKEQQ